MQFSLRVLALRAALCAGAMALAEGVQRYATELPFSCADYSEKLNVRVTYCEQAGNEGARPLIIFFAGFQCPSSWYDSYAEDLAVNGSYVMLQYDTPRVLGVLKPDNTLLPDGIEVQLVPKLVSWVANEASNTSSPLFGRIDTSRIGLMGHSRGGKLAALALASGLAEPTCPSSSSSSSSSSDNGSSNGSSDSGRIEGKACAGTPGNASTQGRQQQQHEQQQQEDQSQQQQQQQQQQCSAGGATLEGPRLAAVLVDPVDSGSGKLGQSESNRPSAVATLKGKERSAAIIAAGINTWCNPINSTWSTFWPMLRSGWLQVVSKAGHMQFTNAEGAWKNIFDGLCWAGDITHAETREFATRGALAWFGNQFDGKSASAYIDWSKEQQRQGRALFEQKAGAEVHEQFASA